MTVLPELGTSFARGLNSSAAERFYRIKIFLILLAGINAAACYASGLSGQLALSGPLEDAPAKAKLIAA